jgi:DMSO reductase family type II enzyme chaperone
MSPEATITAALGRSVIYRTLATAFAYPSAERLHWVAEASRRAAVDAPPDLRDALHRLAAAAAEADASLAAAEHVALFQREVRCPPYEGAYGPPQMAGKATLLADVAGFYRAFGLEPTEDQPEVEDHLAAELEFMSLLALKEAWALAGSSAEGLEVTRGAQRAFLTDHLGRWASAFAARLAETAPPGVHAASAVLLETWLAHECAALGVAPARVQGMTEAEAGAFACPMAPQEKHPS